MRLWSLHPQYLDPKGLGGVWREGLLAQAVLLGKTKGWKQHAHLLRFKKHPTPAYAIGFYLLKIYEEAVERGYRYTREKIREPVDKVQPIPVTTGQVRYEWSILKDRLRLRSPPTYKALLRLEQSAPHPASHPIFVIVKGDVEPWEKAYWRRKQQSAE